uniref:Uncharacterized protein n=1 Tax=Schizaphis graminum TaxID=13262 RepID=A0A2S2NI12_SCHGA
MDILSKMATMTNSLRKKIRELCRPSVQLWPFDQIDSENPSLFTHTHTHTHNGQTRRGRRAIAAIANQVTHTHKVDIPIIGFYLEAHIKGQEDEKEVKGRWWLKAIYSA